MQTTNANLFLKSLQNRVEFHLQQAISTYQNLSADSLNRPAANGGWSIAQCLEHLNTYGDYYLPVISSEINAYKGQPALTAKRGWLGNYFINMMDPDLDHSKYKAFKGHKPASQLDAHAVVARFVGQQEELLALLRRAGTVDLNSLKIPISISKYIRLRLGDTLEFLIMHNERHIRQANKNYKAV